MDATQANGGARAASAPLKTACGHAITECNAWPSVGHELMNEYRARAGHDIILEQAGPPIRAGQGKSMTNKIL